MSDLDEEIQAVLADWRFERCPRCLGRLRTFVHDSGALSRVADVEVCGSCGSDEVGRPEEVPVDEWPILVGAHDYVPRLSDSI